MSQYYATFQIPNHEFFCTCHSI